MLLLHHVGEGGAHQQVDDVADKQEGVVQECAAQEPVVHDHRQDDDGDAPAERAIGADLARIVGSAQAKEGNDQLQGAHDQDQNAHGHGKDARRRLGALEVHCVVQAERVGRRAGGYDDRARKRNQNSEDDHDDRGDAQSFLRTGARGMRHSTSFLENGSFKSKYRSAASDRRAKEPDNGKDGTSAAYPETNADEPAQIPSPRRRRTKAWRPRSQALATRREPSQQQQPFSLPPRSQLRRPSRDGRVRDATISV